MGSPPLFRPSDITSGRKKVVNRLRGQLGKQCLQGRARFQLDQEIKGTIREVGFLLMIDHFII